MVLAGLLGELNGVTSVKSPHTPAPDVWEPALQLRLLQQQGLLLLCV